ncbi:MAG: SpoIIE family protein phosphatase [Nitrospinota bacterium]
MFSEQEKAEFLKESPLFSHMTPGGIKAICAITKETTFPKDHVLFKEGDPGDSLWVLFSGEAALYKNGTLILRLSVPGTCFGEMALVEEGAHRSATVVCTKETTVFVIGREDFFMLMSGDFSVVRGMFRVLNSKLRQDLELRTATIQKDAARRQSMQMAREIQQSLLPEREISHTHLLSSGYCKSAGVVGGDYYDYLHLPEDRFGVFLADVMGYGYHSAMLMAMTKSGLHTQAEFDPSIQGVMGSLRRVASRQNRTWMNLTCCYVIIDIPNRKASFESAGHPPMLHYSAKNNKIAELNSVAAPLGMLKENPDEEFKGEEISWRPGDVLVLYSDGITEAFSPAGELFGTERLLKALFENSSLGPGEIKESILACLNEHLSGGRVEDDLTLVVVKSI